MFDIEIISGNEALERVGCAHLQTPGFDHVQIAWRGHPVAFGCGHTRQGKYELERVSQHLCSGNVLFSFQRLAGKPGHEFPSAVGFAVVVDRVDGDTVLKVVQPC